MLPLTTLAATLAMFQPPPAQTVWGSPEAGVRLGIAIEKVADGGPPVVACYLKNETEKVITLRSDLREPWMSTPVFTLTGKPGAWLVRPTTAAPALWDGPDYRIVMVPGNMTVRLYSPRFFFPITAGRYEIQAEYSTNQEIRGMGTTLKPISFWSGKAVIDIRPADTHPALQGGIG